MQKAAAAMPRRLFRFERGSRIAWVLNREEVSVLGRPGSDLLFQVLRLSTIGAGEFNGRVRDGIGFRPPASTTRSAKNGKPTCCPRGHSSRKKTVPRAQKLMKQAVGLSHAGP